MISPSKVTQLVSRFRRSPDGSRGHLIIFFATEAHPAGFEASSAEIAFFHAPERLNDNLGEYALAELVLNFSFEELVFQEKGSWLANAEGSTCVQFSSIRKRQAGESFANASSAFSDSFA
ncbi:MAG: hypothetical protein ACOYM3_11370 [Terrimicrobiaceae bacterium]